MQLKRIAQLHASMQSQDMTRTRFEFRFQTLVFSVIYIAESFPHILLLGCINSKLFIKVDVNRGYTISAFLGDNYRLLLDALGIKNADPDNRFKASIFFEAFEDATPITTRPSNTPTGLEVMSLSRDVEEADKTHFIGWKTHDGIRSKPTPENLLKTKRAGGHEIYDVCRKHHISSCWTDNPALGRPFFRPPFN